MLSTGLNYLPKQYPLHFLIANSMLPDAAKAVQDRRQEAINEGEEAIGNFYDIMNMRDNNGRNIMHVYALACSKSFINISAAELLLKNGVEINIQDNHGKTPLHACIDAYTNKFASLDNVMPFMGWLLKNGCDPEIRDNNGEKALDQLQRIVQDKARISKPMLEKMYENSERKRLEGLKNFKAQVEEVKSDIIQLQKDYREFGENLQHQIERHGIPTTERQQHTTKHTAQELSEERSTQAYVPGYAYKVNRQREDQAKKGCCVLS
jgi:hypothetical protein